MWQVLLAAAVAGSGILAKKLIINPFATEPISDSKQNEQKFDQPDDLQSSCQPLQSPDNYNETENETSNDGSIFRFSSTSGAEMNSKNVRKKMGWGSKGVRGKVKGFNRISQGKAVKKCGILGCERRGWVVDQRGNGNGKRFCFCLKKRRISKNASGKCESCAAKGNSLFSWGLSVGIMYMMSAGRSEIGRLNNAMDETTKIVQEVKAELSRRKTLHNTCVSNATTELATELNNNGGMRAHQVIPKSSSGKDDALNMHGQPIAEEGECGSSVLTEEQQFDISEIDQMEAELETELQKLPWCALEDSRYEGRVDISQTEVLASEFHPANDEHLNSHEFNGVLPSELDKKLCHLLIEQQESQITDLESQLQRTHAKLYEKEAELEALKDCVKRLTEFSLGSATDDEETEIRLEEKKTGLVDQPKEMDNESRILKVGAKRGMDF